MWAVLQVNEKRWFLALAAIFYWLILLSIILFFHPYLLFNFVTFIVSLSLFLLMLRLFVLPLRINLRRILRNRNCSIRCSNFPILICAPPLYLLLAWNYNTNRNNIYGNLLWYVRVTLQAVHCWKCKNILK